MTTVVACARGAWVRDQRGCAATKLCVSGRLQGQRRSGAEACEDRGTSEGSGGVQTCGQTAATGTSTSAYLGRVAVSKNDAKKRATDRWGLSIVGESARMMIEKTHRRFIGAFRGSSADFHTEVFRGD